MSVGCIEIDEVAKQQAAIAQFIPAFQRAFEQRVITGGLLVEAGGAMAENVGNFSDRDDIAASLLGCVQHRVLRRWHRIIASIRRSLKTVAWSSDEGARDNAADVQGFDETLRDGANLVQTVETKTIFVRGDLEYAIGRGITDRLAGMDMHGAKALDDFRSRGVTIAEDSWQLCLLAKRLDQVGWK